MTVCVYALTGPQPLTSAVRGLAGERLRLVADGPVAAIVGELPRSPRPTRDTLERFDGAVRRLYEQRTALLPARFGSCFSSVDELLYVLRSRRDSLRSAVAHVRGRTQMTVRVLQASASAAGNSAPVRDRDGGPFDARSPSVTASSLPRPDARILDSGARYLRARAAQEAHARDIPRFEAVRDAVRRWVRAERVEKRTRVASVYHLVPRASAEAYRQAAERAAAGAGLRVVVTGPRPPYAFAD